MRCWGFLIPVLYALLQGTCVADLYRHPQLDADIEAVKELYSENAVSVRWVRRPCLGSDSLRLPGPGVVGVDASLW